MKVFFVDYWHTNTCITLEKSVAIPCIYSASASTTNAPIARVADVAMNNAKPT